MWLGASKIVGPEGSLVRMANVTMWREPRAGYGEIANGERGSSVRAQRTLMGMLQLRGSYGGSSPSVVSSNTLIPVSVSGSYEEI